MQMYEALKAYNLPDEHGHFGPYGGVFRRRDADARAR